MNRGQLVARAGRIMGMARSATDSTDELSTLQDLANEAVIDILQRVKIHVRRVALQLTSGETEYDLSQNVVRIWSLQDIDGTPMTEVAEGDLYAYADSHVFQFVGYNRIVLGWEPDDGDFIDAWYTPRPTKMTLDGHDPATQTYGLIPEEFHSAIVNYMCWRAGEISRDQGSGLGEKYRRLYEGEDGLGGMGTDLGRMKWAVNRRGSSGAPQGRLRRAGLKSPADAGAENWR